MKDFETLDVLASGLGAQRVRMSAIASNLANAQTTRTDEGGAYKRISTVFEATALGDELFPDSGTEGVRVAEIVQHTGPGMMVFDPQHPDANEEGYVEFPDINVLAQTIDMMAATRAYEASLTTLSDAVRIARETLEKL